MRGPLHLVVACALGLASLPQALADHERPATGTLRLQLWFNNDRLNPDAMDCRAVFPVERRVPMTQGVAAATLRALFAGPTPAEAATGYRSLFSPASAGLLKSVRIRNGAAYVDMHDLSQGLSGATSSCGAAEFQAQVLRSLQSYPSIERVIYAFEGKPRSFYEWMNESCGSANNYCDPRPFDAGR